MSNEEKYTTTDERFAAFRMFCSKFEKCGYCDLKDHGQFQKCEFAWLKLEADETYKMETKR